MFLSFMTYKYLNSPLIFINFKYILFQIKPMLGLHSLLSKIVLLMAAQWRNQSSIIKHTAKLNFSLSPPLSLSALTTRKYIHVCTTQDKGGVFYPPLTVPCFDDGLYTTTFSINYSWYFIFPIGRSCRIPQLHLWI